MCRHIDAFGKGGVISPPFRSRVIAYLRNQKAEAVEPAKKMSGRACPMSKNKLMQASLRLRPGWGIVFPSGCRIRLVKKTSNNHRAVVQKKLGKYSKGISSDDDEDHSRLLLLVSSLSLQSIATKETAEMMSASKSS